LTEAPRSPTPPGAFGSGMLAGGFAAVLLLPGRVAERTREDA
jgi:hypothetical protein